MSLIGTLLLTHCDNDLRIDYRTFHKLFPQFFFSEIKSTADNIGVQLEHVPMLEFMGWAIQPGGHKRAVVHAILDGVQLIESRCFGIASIAAQHIKDPLLSARLEKIRLEAEETVRYIQAALDEGVRERE